MESTINHFQTPVSPICWDRDQSLMISIQIQSAYEQERPLSIVYQRETQTMHFCGYIDQIDPSERWIRLYNGDLTETIYFPSIELIEML